MITHKQLTLAEIFDDCQNKFDNDKYQFLSLLDEAINLDEIVPVSFISHFHASTGRPRKHQLYPMLKALLLQRIFSTLCKSSIFATFIHLLLLNYLKNKELQIITLRHICRIRPENRMIRRLCSEFHLTESLVCCLCSFFYRLC